VSSLVLSSGETLTYPYLGGLWRRALRNGNWTKLAKARGRIKNTALTVQILQIAFRLLQARRLSIAKAGWKRATIMLNAYAQADGVLSWAPRLRRLLHDPRYVWYLGVLAVNR